MVAITAATFFYCSAYLTNCAKSRSATGFLPKSGVRFKLQKIIFPLPHGITPTVVAITGGALHRPHQGIDNQVPDNIGNERLPIANLHGGGNHNLHNIRCEEFLGGLLKSYYRKAV